MNEASVIGKIIITGELILRSPLLIGDGAGETFDNTRDIHVLKDRNNRPFIPGTSLCGVLREYMSNVEPQLIAPIFGDAERMQSSLRLDDVVLEDFAIVVRDGVRIDGFTGTGIKGGKYDYEAVDRGAHGGLQMQFTLRRCHELDEIKDAIARLMKRLELGIRLGALTSKGFGLIAVENISADFFDFRERKDTVAWLKHSAASKKILPSNADDISSRADLIVDAEFIANSSFIIRDYDINEKFGSNKIAARSLQSRNEFIIPGTSLKGVFRHHAEYILRLIGARPDVLDKLMGMSTNERKLKSRFIVAETYVSNKNVREALHSRTRIDRFTGGVLQGALFTTKPVWQKNSAPSINIHFEIRNVESEAEVGLAIALLRDMWLGRVAIGGEKSIGRGTLQGISARLEYDGKTYEPDRQGKVIGGDSEEFIRPARDQIIRGGGMIE